jgi:hypothetical protein
VDTQNSNKLNQLMTTWPHGTVAVQKWLSKNGVSRFLARAYVKSGWIKSLGSGAFARAEDKLTWSGGLYAVQQQLSLPVHVGGESAMQWHGQGHYLPIGGNAPLQLFGPLGVKPPSWFMKNKWEQKIRYRNTNFLPYGKNYGVTTDDRTGFPLVLSTPERAIFEVLFMVPNHVSFENAANLMEGLATLRPNLVNTLLWACRSVKVKRAFLYMAEQANHPWFGKLNLSRLRLGKGKRVIVPGGKFDKKYQITVSPKSVMGAA